MPGTSIPDAVDALVAAFSSVTIDNFQVFDGPEFNPEGDFLSVGWTDQSNINPTASGTAATMDYGLSEALETYTIVNLLRIWVGDEVLGNARRRLFGLFNQVVAPLNADHTLGGVVLMAWIGAYDLTPYLNANGGYLDLVFTVSVQASKQ